MHGVIVNMTKWQGPLLLTMHKQHFLFIFSQGIGVGFILYTDTLLLSSVLAVKILKVALS